MMTLLQIVNPVITGIGAPGSTADPGTLVGKFISSLVALLLVVATIYAFLQLLQGALQWISSGGDKGNLENAQNHITSAVLGLVIVFISWAVYLIVLRFLGIIPSSGGPGFIFKIPTLL